jgi:2-hydroxychromene-2-carboxylate isomerase
LFRAEFCEGRNIAEEAVLNAALKEAGADPGIAFPASRSEEVKGRLKAETEYAKSRGIFGAPTFVTQDGELFWGDDRLEEALDWARTAADAVLAAGRTRPGTTHRRLAACG